MSAKAEHASRRAAPPLFLAAALMFWGWQSGFLLQGALMGAALEAISLGRVRLEIRPADFSRVLDLCVVIFLGEALYLYLTPMEESLLLMLAIWLPFALFPLALAECASSEGEVSLSALLYTVRRKRAKAGRTPFRLRFAPVFGMVCVFSAGAVNERTGLFFLGASLLLCWWLFWRRPGRYTWGAWGLAALLAVAVGWFGQWGINHVQEAVRDWVHHDPFRRTTAIGELGELKFSDAIVLRIEPEQDLELPLLLHENSYNFFDGRQWVSSGAEFIRVPSAGGAEGAEDETPEDWRLENYNETPPPVDAQEKSVTVYQSFYRRGGLLFLPEGTWRVDELPVGRVEQSQLGAVRAAGAPGLVAYTARYRNGASLQGSPTAVERIVPRDREIIEGILRELGVEGMAPLEKAMAIRDHLRSAYGYSLKLERNHPEMSPLAEFLLASRKGHCEYFAMAAVYMLRAAGIPSRYAVGYSVQEYSVAEEMLIARERHAHSWALAWIGGQWIPVDATPVIWFAEEAAGESWLRDLADFRQRMAFAFARWRWLGEDARTKRILLWTAGPLLVFLLYRLGRRMRIGKGGERSRKRDEFGLDRVERILARRGFARGASEPWQVYLARAGEAGLAEVVSLYYRARFDPRGLDEQGRRELREKTAAWLRSAGKRPAARPEKD